MRRTRRIRLRSAVLMHGHKHLSPVVIAARRGLLAHPRPGDPLPVLRHVHRGEQLEEVPRERLRVLGRDAPRLVFRPIGIHTRCPQPPEGVRWRLRAVERRGDRVHADDGEADAVCLQVLEVRAVRVDVVERVEWEPVVGVEREALQLSPRARERRDVDGLDSWGESTGAERE